MPRQRCRSRYFSQNVPGLSRQRSDYILAENSVRYVSDSKKPVRSVTEKVRLLTRPAKKCHGAGRIRKIATLTVDIPAGIDDRQIINARGQGNKGANGGPAGDLRIAVNVRPHPIFERDGYNVWVEMHISFPAAALGCELQVPTLDGKVKYNVPQALRAERYLSLKTRGIQSLNGRGHGDELVRVIVDVPRELTSEQKMSL